MYTIIIRIFVVKYRNMEITKKLLKELFKKYNSLYFDNVLPICEFHYLKLDSIGTYTNGGKTGKIWITNDVDWTDETLRDVLVHEMIHHYIDTVEKKKFDGLFGHGFFFRRKMNKINKKFGLNIKTFFSDIKLKNKK